MLRFIGFGFACLLLSSFAACNGSGSDQMTVTLSASTLPMLGSGYVYEGWLVTPAGPQSTGRFSVDTSGTPTPATFHVASSVVNAATASVITIEPAVDTDPAPSKVHIAGGAFAASLADLSASDASALDTDFSSAAGTYVLATPTTASNTADNDQGIWWLVPPTAPGGSPTAGLTLPTLPSGWMYEGWVASAAGPVSTGKFRSPAGADSDGAGPASGADAPPSFPGQDFISPPLVLTSGFKTVITVEPDPDDAPTPFAIKPLIADPIGTATAPTSLPMHRMTETLPSIHVAAR